MMKLKFCAISMACVMAAALVGCSANRENNNSAAPVQPTNSVASDYNDRPSADINGAQNGTGMDDSDRNSAGVDGIQNSANVGNDAAQGGGAGGTNDQNNDGVPDNNTARNRSGSNNMIDDVGDAAGNLTRGAGNAVRDAGNAIGNAANDVGRAMR